MTTPRIRPAVSRSAALSLALALGACASGAPTRLALREPVSVPAPTAAAPRTEDAVTPARAPEPAATLHFDNQSHDQARVYLVDERRQWLLGRVEPGARSTLRIPREAIAGATGPMRLAVRTGDRATGETRAVLGAADPVANLLVQRWSFFSTMTGGELTGMPVSRSEAAPR